jgi:rare lipoprotein A
MRKVLLGGLLLTFFQMLSLQAQSLIGYQQKGRASYYASKFNGRPTANGEKFSNKELTAAHRTLPFNTLLKVTNPANGKEVLVRVNDRGPFSPNKMLDLSLAAAERLGIVQAGVASVTIEVVGMDDMVADLPVTGSAADADKPLQARTLTPQPIILDQRIAVLPGRGK